MRTSSLTARRPVAADLAFLAPSPHPTKTAAYGPPLSQRDIELTPKGMKYVAEHSKSVGEHTFAPRAEIESSIELHLGIVTALLALLDDADGDPDFEEDDDFAVDDEPCDANTSEDMEYDPGDSPFYPNGAHLFGGGSGI